MGKKNKQKNQKKEKRQKWAEPFTLVDGYLKSASPGTCWSKMQAWAKANKYLLGEIYKVDFSDRANWGSQWLTECFRNGVPCYEWGTILVQLLSLTVTSNPICIGNGFDSCMCAGNYPCKGESNGEVYS